MRTNVRNLFFVALGCRDRWIVSPAAAPMSEITAADASEAIIKLASIGASKFSSTFDKELLERAISAFTSDRDVSRLRGLAMVGSSTKEEVAFVDSVMSAFEATS